MERIKLTKEKLMEIISKCDDDDAMEYYYKAACNDKFAAYQNTDLVILLVALVRYKHTKLCVETSINPLDFFGLKKINRNSPYWKYYELLEMTNLQIAMCLINDEPIPEQVLVKFSEIQVHALFLFGHYLSSLKISHNALARDDKNTLCNYIKASLIDLCLVNKTPIAYKVALLNHQKSLIAKCDKAKFPLNKQLFELVVEIIDNNTKDFGETEKHIAFTPICETYEKTKEIVPEWTKEHDFYLKNNLFLNPLSNFGKFIEASYEELETLSISPVSNDYFKEIINDYKFCRSLTYSFCEGINNVGKREMSMVYSYTYTIFDKIAYLLSKVYNLNIDDDKTGFTEKGLFKVKIKDSNIRFRDIKNNNILPLYIIMKEAREKNKFNNALQVGTFEHNELRNTIDHKSFALVDEMKLRRNAPMLLERVRDAILYTFMLLSSCPSNTTTNSPTAISTTFLKTLINKTPQ